MGPFRQRGISLAIAVFLAVLPLGGAVCATLCVPAGSAASVPADHHGDAAGCHETGSTGPEFRSTAGHDCKAHEPALLEITASLTAARADSGVLSIAQLVGPAALTAPGLVSAARTPGSRAPLGVALRTAAPLVLRI